ncbi:hypothetical protein BA195_02715 [Tenacibaculum soleae]|uniref:Uncharacterized protein n=1 Tax=Tenacibaculum soleae TaxID=447689 RepID=A0A1B9Y1F5_9FLAO|nr:hypothetical protein BA195_02715 [Tenacibaculum soleae]
MHLLHENADANILFLHQNNLLFRKLIQLFFKYTSFFIFYVTNNLVSRHIYQNQLKLKINQ